MDGHRFDQLSRAFAAAAWSRRGVLKGLATGIAGGIAGLLGLGEVGAQLRCRPGGHICRIHADCCPPAAGEPGVCLKPDQYEGSYGRRRCLCEEGLTNCGGKCVDLRSDQRNCGTCGHRCRGGHVCCDGGCTDLTSDPANCGECGFACEEGQDCCGGECVDLGTVDNCASCGDFCDEGQDCCDGVCTDLGTDENCTACGDACGEDEVCCDTFYGLACADPSDCSEVIP